MSKIIHVDSCSTCPYGKIKETIDDEDFWCCTHENFPYGRSNWCKGNEIINDCPLDDVPLSEGEFTLEELKQINDNARQIKNAKNVKDGRYG